MKIRSLMTLLAALALLTIVCPSQASLAILSIMPFGAVCLLDEDRLSLNELAQREAVNPSTVWRWSLRGVKGVKLEVFSVGGRRYTTSEAFERWVAATNATRDEQSATTRTSRQRELSIELAERELAQDGI